MTQRELYNHLCDVRFRIKEDSYKAEDNIASATDRRDFSEIDELIYIGDCHIAARGILTTYINQLRLDQWEEAIQLNKEI